MAPAVVHVFVSSTWLDLRPERLAVEAALGRMRQTKFAGMEFFGSRDEDTRTASLDEVDRSHLYVGIIGGRYGSGITEAEYRRARERKLPCFLYLKDEARITTGEREADADKVRLLDALKEELRRQHIVTTFGSPDDLAAKVTADLHRWLFDQHSAPLPIAESDDERLRKAYIDPWSVFERVQLDHFVGREWLTERVDAFLRENPRGYFILEAAAGLGKTAYLAHLVRERGYIHLFAEQARGQDGAATGLKSLAAQLIRACKLNPYSADDVLPRAAVRPDFLEGLLVEAARQRDERRPGEPIVLVVDGLDEAGTPPGQNVLGLPRVLPLGVFVLVSHRPVPVSLNVEEPSCRYQFQSESAQNLDDMRRHLERAASWRGIAKALRDSGNTAERFIATLLEKCHGVWIYLHYVLAEIEGGKRSPLNLDALPRKVSGYYAEFWRRQRDADPAAWDQTWLPLLGTLGAVQEGVSGTILFELAGITRAQQGSCRRMLEEQWRPWLGARSDVLHRLKAVASV